MAKVSQVKKARKAFIAEDGKEVKVGDPYYWWKFKFGVRKTSTTYPKPQQLTQSGFMQSLYGIQEMISALSPSDEGSLEDALQNITTEIQDLLDEQQSNLENMPEHLQESSSSGQLLQERIDALENWISDLEDITVGVDENEIKTDAASELGIEDVDNIAEDKADEFAELVQTKTEEAYQNIVDEIQSTDSGL